MTKLWILNTRYMMSRVTTTNNFHVVYQREYEDSEGVYEPYFYLHLQFLKTVFLTKDYKLFKNRKL